MMNRRSYRLNYLLWKFVVAFRYGRQNGIGPLFELIKLKLRPSKKGHFLAKNNVIAFYDFVRNRPVGHPLIPGEVPRNTINWVIPYFGFGSGGHLNIFRFVHFLEKFGYECRIIIEGEPLPSSAEKARSQISEWFFPIKAPVYVGIENAPPAHVSIATNWVTAYMVRNYQGTLHRCYFVQDFEPYFYASGSEYAWAEETYRFGFFGITAGGWLEEKLAREYGMKTASFGFSYDRDRYRPIARREKNIRRILFYARPPTPRRAFELGMLTLGEVVKRLPDVKVVFAGWDVSGYEIPFEHLNCGVLSLDELPDLYSQCDAALVLSFSNLSLLPLELMACGTPVVSNKAPYTQWLLDEQNAVLAEPTVEALAEALCAVLENPDKAARLREAGYRTASATNWQAEARRVADMLESLDGEALGHGKEA